MFAFRYIKAADLSTTMPNNPHALYIYCDGAMDYGPNSFGGVGIVVKFPDSVGMEDIEISIGRYSKSNIERIEMEALIKAMETAIDLYGKYWNELRNVRQVIFVTDRFGLADDRRLNAYQIRDWRSMGWKNHEGKPIKNHKLIDKLDKTRAKLSKEARAIVSIEYRKRKFNRAADKQAKKGKTEGMINTGLEKVSEKIGKRFFDGGEIPYKAYKENQELHIRIFRKDPVQDLWEVWAEICTGNHQGMKLKIYVDDGVAELLQRGNEFIVKLSNVFRYYFRIHDTVTKIEKKKEENVETAS
ncbi:MAG: RNase H family protein [Sediminibacterium sp.]